MSVASSPVRFQPPRHFDNGAEWMRALGDVPLERIIFDPWPGTATEADLLLLVERDKRLCELIDGTLVEKPVGWQEALIATRLSARLLIAVDAGIGGFVSGADSTLRMSSGRVRLPDVAYISRQRLPGGIVPSEPIPTLAPDLAVEVLSDSNTPAEMTQKLTEYFQSGTRLAWIIDPRSRTVSVYRTAGKANRVLQETDRLPGEEVIPGFEIVISELFKDLPAKKID